MQTEPLKLKDETNRACLDRLNSSLNFVSNLENRLKFDRSDLIVDWDYDEVAVINEPNVHMDLGLTQIHWACSDRLFEEFPSMPNSSGLLVQADEGFLFPVVDLIRRIYRRLP
ncbi:hypothetical protein F511_27756 [Dorcoceras hygrometricum]|uniref:Uncharacterized protein n=1 Tax=Dorcoceras hygrometricum TaxID=472368 RepID=A0A2Z7BID4_9LAMI|nr:hypothetical protein F511_27756 [Dorcoceras hygrometricum]